MQTCADEHPGMDKDGHSPVGLVLQFVEKGRHTEQSKPDTDSMEEVTVKYATGFSVRDSADIRLIDVGKKDHFALVHDAEEVMALSLQPTT